MVTAPPLIAVVPVASVVSEASAAEPPTMPPNVVVPAVLSAKVCAPLRVVANVSAPLPVLVNDVAAPSVTASL